ncbi:MAG TPA: lipoyl(octanoyl) transferase LipB [Candidatus Megaira endosymbiont of Stentor roeselii]|nr:lipoyl(octanoyl) transferase LipB [Rickettsiaceae bacterium]UCM94527.1 MAG: lipoyl(octanoyl) transferase LipB [Candidatus Megaira endosymbiont of Mesostigma viride]HJK85341.1 lipoyl(octanoyl) transferase LipB [Candidatus Megaera endosymbiont of Stentor roeselii]HJK87903.1 lipoyl(octanoyl) transferase LipB [Candidatus Megaira endosymbiont of Mesostigma viride]
MVKWITLPGLVDYQEGIKIMEGQLDRVINSMQPDTIFLLEHKEVYTAGTSHNVEELLKPDSFPVIYTGRGGKFTYHGPGQRIIYPIINLNNTDKVKDLKLYITQLEKWIILTLAELDVNAFTIQGKVGIWVKNSRNIESKIGAIGIRVRKWVTYHGIAVNISPNLDNYSGIIPCGINDFPITSLEDMGINISITEFDIILKKKFIEIF